MHFMFLSQKSIQLTYKLSLPLICTLFKSIFLLILFGNIAQYYLVHGNTTQKLMQNYVAHNNPVAVTVSFFSIESFKIISNIIVTL